MNPGGQSTAKQNGLANIPNKIVNFSNINIVQIKMISITDRYFRNGFLFYNFFDFQIYVIKEEQIGGTIDWQFTLCTFNII